MVLGEGRGAGEERVGVACDDILRTLYSGGYH